MESERLRTSSTWRGVNVWLRRLEGAGGGAPQKGASMLEPSQNIAFGEMVEVCMSCHVMSCHSVMVCITVKVKNY